MGVNIYVVRLNADQSWENHPEWDTLRYAGDRDLAKFLPVKKQIGDPYDCTYWQRPNDPAEMLDAMEIAHPENSKRWRQLEEIFRDQSWWVYVSY